MNYNNIFELLSYDMSDLDGVHHNILDEKEFDSNSNIPKLNIRKTKHYNKPKIKKKKNMNLFFSFFFFFS